MIVDFDPEDTPKSWAKDIRKVIQWFNRKAERKRPIYIIFSDDAEWGYQEDSHIIIGSELSKSQTLLMLIHELCHVILKMNHDKKTRALGYRSFWRKYKDRDVFSERLAYRILRRRIYW